MAVTLRNLLPVSIFILSMLVLALLPMPGGSASAQSCGVAICKVAPQVEVGPLVVEPEDPIFFTFDVRLESQSSTLDLIANGRCVVYGMAEGDDLEVVERVPTGWRLSDVQCDQQPGVSVTLIDNGAVISCNEQTEQIVECNFVNLIATNIPTLSEWGMIAAAAGLGVVGVFFALRRKRLQTGA